MSPRSASARAPASGARSTADGCMVARTGAPRCCVRRNDRPRTDQAEFVVEPGAAGGGFAGGRFLVDPAGAPGATLPLEVLNRIGDVDLGSLDPGRRQRAVEDDARRADKGVTLAVLLIARLLADEHERRMRRPLAKHGLGCPRPEVAVPAVEGGRPHRRQAGSRHARHGGTTRARPAPSPTRSECSPGARRRRTTPAQPAFQIERAIV
jgi:hypothetical protein